MKIEDIGDNNAFVSTILLIVLGIIGLFFVASKDEGCTYANCGEACERGGSEGHRGRMAHWDKTTGCVCVTGDTDGGK